MSVKDHYDDHLADFYEWMIGDFTLRQLEQESYFNINGISSNSNELAVDLGAGNGIQSISLARLGFAVKAIDFNRQLLDKLQSRINDLDIEVIQRDFLSIGDYVSTANIIVCMGDTIAHIDSFEKLQVLFNDCYKILTSEGKLILSYRDYGKALIDTGRFIPVKADDDRILTCVLEYFDNRVNVTDLLYEYQNGQWIQKISCYQKLRLSMNIVENMIQKAGFTLIKNDDIKGMKYLIAGKVMQST